VKTVAESTVLRSLRERLGAIQDGSVRRWGTLTPHEMLCHLGDANAIVLGLRPRKGPVLDRRRPLVKWVGLWSPLPWPHAWPTNPAHDPKAEGTRPSDFAKDLARALEGLERSTSSPAMVEPMVRIYSILPSVQIFILART
jgi:hypothetical protein